MGHGDVILVNLAATYFSSFPLTYHKWQQLLSYGNSEGTHHLIVLTDWSLYNHNVMIVRD